MTRSGCLPVLFGVAARWAVLVGVVSVLAPAPARSAGRVILDEGAYCRSYCLFGPDHISPAALKQEPGKVLSGNDLVRLERRVKGYWQDRRIDWTKTDWREVAVTRISRMGDSMERARAAYTDPPPVDWAQPDFDDSAWPRFKRPLGVGQPSGVHFGQFRAESPGLNEAHYRYGFEVPDPRQAGDLTLNLSYIGGVRVYLNGVEVARGSLPSGELDSATMAEAYPEEAYKRLYAELAGEEKVRADRKLAGKPAPRYAGYVGFLMPFEEARLPRGCWDRIQRLRKRELAVRVPSQLLRKGSNVLAVAVRCAYLHPLTTLEDWNPQGPERPPIWLHLGLTAMKLESTGGGLTSGLGGFSAVVGFNEAFEKDGWANRGAVVCFEIHVDGRLRAASGLMKVGDAPRLLAVDGLQGAKTLQLCTRLDDGKDDAKVLAAWGDPTVYGNPARRCWPSAVRRRCRFIRTRPRSLSASGPSWGR